MKFDLTDFLEPKALLAVNGGASCSGGSCSSGKSDSIYGAPTNSRRVTGVVGEETALQSVHTGIDIGALEPGKKVIQYML